METREEHYASMMQAVQRYAPSADLEEIQKAYEYADRKHKNQLRKSGEPYIIHPLAVAEIVAEIGLDTDAIVAALLHDCLEDTDSADDAVRTLNIFCPVPDRNGNALCHQFVGRNRGVHIRTGNLHAHAAQHQPQRAHGNAADADQVRVSAGL